jgi:hypothetical protein
MTQVAFMDAEVLAAAIRKHRDQKGDDRCWMDDEELYSVLPEGYTPPERTSEVELEFCKKFISCRRNPKTTYVSPQRRIEELEAEIHEIKRLMTQESWFPLLILLVDKNQQMIVNSPEEIPTGATFKVIKTKYRP